MQTGIPLDGEFNVQTAVFWAKFQTDSGGAQEHHTNAVSVYSTPSKGQFFIVNTTPGGMPTHYDLAENRAELEKFLEERREFILRHYD